MKNITLIILLVLTSVGINAQNINLDWVKRTGGTANDVSNAVAVDNDGNVYTTGSFIGTSDFDPGAAVFNLTAVGQEDFFITKLDSSGNFLWAIAIGGTGIDRSLSITLDNAANCYITGFFTGTVDFDPGAGVTNLTSAFVLDNFVCKLDVSGNLIWAKNIGSGASSSFAGAVKVDALGNVYTCGSFFGTSDFDPDTSAMFLTSFGNDDVFISKLNSSGNFVWAKQMGGTAIDWGWGMTIDGDGNVYTTGVFQATADFDPGTGNFSITTAGGTDIFISKLDSAGNFVWAKSMGGSVADFGYAIATDELQNVYTAGAYQGTADFDPGAGAFFLTTVGPLSSDAFIAKLNSSGNFVWAKSMGGASYDYVKSIVLDTLANIYTTGQYALNGDFDPGTGVTTLSAVGNYDVFISKLDSAGNYINAVSVGGFLVDDAKSITVDLAGTIFVTGDFNGTADFNPGAGTFNLTSAGSTDVFILKLNQNYCPDLALVYDSIANVNCNPPNGYIAVHTINGTAPYSYTWNVFPADNDSVYVPLAGGIFEVDVVDAVGCSTTTAVLIDQPEPLFGFDLGVNMVRNRGFRPGFSVNIVLDAYNLGCNTINASLYLILDLTEVSYDSASIPPTFISGDTLMWNIPGISYDSAHFKPVVYLTTNITTVIGDTVCLKTYILPIAGDVDSSNNEKRVCRAIMNGFDPNDKQVYPGECAQGYVELDQRMEYTINFQNTGNASAINVFLLDTLDAVLDINTLRVASNSHPVITEIFPGNIVKFRFDNINLIDSNANEPASHGFVGYEIEPLSSIASGTVVENSAGIYFDFNAPVITNTVANTFINSIPNCFIGIEAFAKDVGGFTIYPNPVSTSLTIKSLDVINEIKVFDVMGKEIFSTVLQNSKFKIHHSIFHIDVSKFETEFTLCN